MVVQAAPAPAAIAPAHRPAANRAARSRGPWVPWTAGLVLALAVALACFAVWLDPRFDYLVDDGLFHTLRAGVFDAVWRRQSPLLYPRWVPELTMGFGYPLLNFYSPGIYYLAEGFHLLGATTYRAMQLLGLTCVLLGAAGAYALGATLFRRPLAALVLALVYVGSPYPFVTNLYNRAAFPEALGLALLPWLLAAATLAVRRGGRLAPLALALALAALVLVHTLTAFVAAGILLLWTGAALLGVPPAGRRAGATAAATGVALGLALSAAFWVPVFAEQRAVQTERGWGTSLSGSVWFFDPLGRQPPAPVSARRRALPHHRRALRPQLGLPAPPEPRPPAGQALPGPGALPAAQPRRRPAPAGATGATATPPSPPPARRTSRPSPLPWWA